MDIIQKLKECSGCKRRREKLKKVAAMVQARFDLALGRINREEVKNGKDCRAADGASGVSSVDFDENGSAAD